MAESRRIWFRDHATTFKFAFIYRQLSSLLVRVRVVGGHTYNGVADCLIALQFCECIDLIEYFSEYLLGRECSLYTLYRDITGIISLTNTTFNEVGQGAP